MLLDSLILTRACWYVAFQQNGVLWVISSRSGAVRVLKLGINGLMSFQTRIDQTFEGCRSVIGIADDIMVYGDSEASHDANMHGMISRCKETGLKLIPDKCFIKQDQIKFSVLFETPPIFLKIVANPLHFRYVNAAKCHISTPGTM